MQLLYLIGFSGRNADAGVGQGRQAAFAGAGKADDSHSLGLRGNGGIQHVLAVSRGGNGQQGISFLPVSDYLLGKDQLWFAVILEGGR